MKKWVCTVCGYVHEGETAPEKCPVCNAPASKFQEQAGAMSWAAEHVVGVAQGSSEDIMADLRANYEGECKEVGMYLAVWQSFQSFVICWTSLSMRWINIQKISALSRRNRITAAR